MQKVKETVNSHPFPWKGLIPLVVGLLFVGWLFNTPEGLLGKADAIGYAVCHRIDTRSFHLGDHQMPLCARCSGMYLGAVLGLTYQAITSRRKAGVPPWRVMVFLGIFVLAFILDGANSFFSFFPSEISLYEPRNWIRLLTGTGMGIVIAAAIFPSFNQTVWSDWDGDPALPGIRSLAVLVVCALILDLVVLTENPFVLYPLALISAAGVVFLLTLIYTMVVLMIFRSENQFASVSQLLFPAIAGFGLALVQIALLDFMRYLVTGTWEGFHLG